MKFKFNHNNFNVLDLEKSIAFYEEALGLKVVNEFKAPDGLYSGLHGRCQDEASSGTDLASRQEGSVQSGRQ